MSDRNFPHADRFFKRSEGKEFKIITKIIYFKSIFEYERFIIENEGYILSSELLLEDGEGMKFHFSLSELLGLE